MPKKCYLPLVIAAVLFIVAVCIGFNADFAKNAIAYYTLNTLGIMFFLVFCVLKFNASDICSSETPHNS